MKRFLILNLFGLLLLPCLVFGFSGKLVKVTDGDTVEVLNNGKAEKIRLSDIDSPERGQAYGKKAKDFVLDTAAGQIVKVDVRTTDRYGRTVGEVILSDGRSLNRELVKEGYAWWYQKYSNDASYGPLEAEARSSGKGLWSDPAAIPPWEFRNGPVGSRGPPQQTIAKNVNVQSQTVYITRTGAKYHADGCRYLKSRIPVSLKEAKDRSYAPCKVCGPPQ